VLSHARAVRYVWRSRGNPFEPPVFQVPQEQRPDPSGVRLRQFPTSDRPPKGGEELDFHKVADRKRAPPRWTSA